jgi:hypothetical protein
MVMDSVKAALFRLASNFEKKSLIKTLHIDYQKAHNRALFDSNVIICGISRDSLEVFDNRPFGLSPV